MAIWLIGSAMGAPGLAFAQLDPEAPGAQATPAAPGKPADAPGEPAEAPAPGPAPPEAPAWIDTQRLTVEQRLGGLIDLFDRFFAEDRQLDMESPSTRLRFKTFGRTAEDRRFSWGTAAAASVHLPRLQRWFGNARLVLAGENASPGTPASATGTPLPDGEAPPAPPIEPTATDLSRSRGRAELRFDMVRRDPLVFDTGAGFSFAWPPVPFARFRTHLRLPLGAGVVLRATGVLFVELGGQGAGTSADALVERYFGATLRLKWQGHAIYAQHTRGVEWDTLTAAEWKVHPRTGLYAGVSAYGFGTPEPTLESWRTFTGVRRDVWSGWVFAELEPEVAWPRRPGEAREQVLAVTLRLEAVLDARPATGRAAR